MRFLVDECTGPLVAAWLRQQGYEVFSVYEQARGLNDDTILQKAFQEDWVLVTNDKDFGEKVYRECKPHRGVIFMRLSDDRAMKKIETLRLLLSAYPERIQNCFVVATENQVRFRK